MEKGHMEEHYEKRLVLINERNRLLRKAAVEELRETASSFIIHPELLKQLADILLEADEEAQRISEYLADEVNKRLEAERAERDKSTADIVGDRF